MTRHPFDRSELDRADLDLDLVAERLEAFAADAADDPPVDLANRIRDRLDREPVPGGWWAPFVGWLNGRGVGLGLLGTAVLALAVVGVLAFGELAGWVRQADVGGSPTPSVSAPAVTPSPTPTLSPSPTSSPSPSPSPSPTAAPPSPSPSETEDDELETPEPSETEHDDDDDDDSSGPGGGGGNSGPGGGG